MPFAVSGLRSVGVTMMRGRWAWPSCARPGCTVPLDPAATIGGHDRHPGCDDEPASDPTRIARAGDEVDPMWLPKPRRKV